MTSKKYLTIIVSLLVIIGAVVLAVSQIFVKQSSEPEIIPFSIGPSGPPNVTPPTAPPPGI